MSDDKIIHLPDPGWSSAASDEEVDLAVDLAMDAGDELTGLYAHDLSPCLSAKCVSTGAFDYLIETVGYEKAREAFDELAEWFKEQAKR